MSDDLQVRHATVDDADDVVHLLTEATEWLARKGSDQWQHMERRDEGVFRAINEHTLHLVVDRSLVVGTFIVDELADVDFWGPRDRVRSALYIHRMAVARDRAGESIGSAMLDWAGRLALSSGRSHVRLDAWRSNRALHEYYRMQGFRHVRTVHPPPDRPRGSGVLFERSARIQRSEGPLLVADCPVGSRPSRVGYPAPLASPHGRVDRDRLVPA